MESRSLRAFFCNDTRKYTLQFNLKFGISGQFDMLSFFGWVFCAHNLLVLDSRCFYKGGKYRVGRAAESSIVAPASKDGFRFGTYSFRRFVSLLGQRVVSDSC
jgi:hypothetical protein